MRPDGRSSRGRELAMLALCHLESYEPEEWAGALDVFWARPRPDAASSDGDAGAQGRVSELAGDASSRRLARKLVAAVTDRFADIDAMIGATATGWSVGRMSRVDRNLLRMAAAELLTAATPRAVVVSEVVGLAGRYGSERSASFVNGVADALALAARPGAEQ